MEREYSSVAGLTRAVYFTIKSLAESNGSSRGALFCRSSQPRQRHRSNHKAKGMQMEMVAFFSRQKNRSVGFCVNGELNYSHAHVSCSVEATAVYV